MGATTFAELIAAPESEKVFLCEVKPGEVVTNFTLTTDQTYTYQISYLNETVTLADSSTETILKTVIACQSDGVNMAVKTSIAEVEAAAGSYWHDTTNGIFYIHPTDDGSPNHHTVIVFFWAYFATKGITLDSRYYEPYIAQNGIPAITQETQMIHWGASQISSGSVILQNGRGFFDQISRRWIWNNKEIRILLGGDDLPYSEYTAIFVGRIMQSRFTKTAFTLEIQSKAFALLGTLPHDSFLTSNFPNLEPSAEGRPMPYYWGSYSEAQAPIVTCVDTAYAAGEYKFKICDCSRHAIKSITQVYVDYQDGVGWQTIAHSNEDLTNGTFTIASASFVVGTSRVKVAFEGYHSGGTLIEGAPEIVEDILIYLCGYTAADLNSSSFTASKAASDVLLNVPVESRISALSVIEKCCQSDLAFFDEDGTGLLRYRTWEPLTDTAAPVLAKEEILEPPEVTDDTSKLYYSIWIGYGRLTDGTCLYTVQSNEDSRYKYGRDDRLTLDTYLRGSANAGILAGRINWITRSPSPILTLKLKAPVIDKALGDKIRVTLARAPFETAGGYVEREFEIISKSISCFPLYTTIKARDARGFGEDVGYWMDDLWLDAGHTVPQAWSNMTAQERDDSGFWTDDDGLVDPADAASKNKSLWW